MTLQDWQSELKRNRGMNNTTETVTDVLTISCCQKLPLNQKQRLVAEKVLSEAISWKDHPYDASKRDQMLLY